MKTYGRSLLGYQLLGHHCGAPSTMRCPSQGRWNTSFLYKPANFVIRKFGRLGKKVSKLDGTKPNKLSKSGGSRGKAFVLLHQCGFLWPIFRFSGARITVQDRPRSSTCLFSGPRCTPIDTDERGCMRLGMRLPRSIHAVFVTPDHVRSRRGQSRTPPVVVITPSRWPVATATVGDAVLDTLRPVHRQAEVREYQSA